MTVISPCISICRINPRSRLCEGCRRSMTEIAAWLDYSTDQKRAIIDDLPTRDPFEAKQPTD